LTVKKNVVIWGDPFHLVRHFVQQTLLAIFLSA
jgi:hypothetical protein